MNTSLAPNKIPFNRFHYQAESMRLLSPNLMSYAALIAFEGFNYAVTHFALWNMLGGMTAAGIYWSAILAFAFCCIDLAGITRLCAPMNGLIRRKNNHFLYGAWLLAFLLNAFLTCRGLAMAIIIQQSRTNWVVSSDVIQRAIPIFTTVMLTLIRILMIGALTQSAERRMVLSNRMSPPDPSGLNTRIGSPQHLEGNVPNMHPYPDRKESFSLDTMARREPTYRGIPIRFKTN